MSMANGMMMGAHLPVPVLDNCVSGIDNGAVEVEEDTRERMDLARTGERRSLGGHLGRESDVQIKRLLAYRGFSKFVSQCSGRGNVCMYVCVSQLELREKFIYNVCQVCTQ